MGNRIAVFAVIGVLLGILAMPASAQNRHGVRLRGRIVALDRNGHGFVLRSFQPASEGVWTVRITGRTRVLVATRDNDDDDEGEEADRSLGVGDFVGVAGFDLGDGRIVAQVVRIFGQPNGFQGAFPGRPPFFGRPTLVAPQIFSPADGAEVTGFAISVVGRTLPWAAVHVEVSPNVIGLFGGLFSRTTTADVTADGRGVFTATVRLPGRFPGMTYAITVTATLSDVTSPPTTITVRHI